MKPTRIFRQIHIALTFLLLSVSSATIVAATPDKPKYVGVYVECDGKLAPIGWATTEHQAAVFVCTNFAIVTYGISINLGGGDILNPTIVVGLQVPGHTFSVPLTIEPLDMGEHYYRYTLPFTGPPNGVYSFFIRSRITGDKDSYYFQIERNAEHPSAEISP